MKNKPCKDCWQTINIYGVDLSSVLERMPSRESLYNADHIGEGRNHSDHPYEFCSGHYPLTEFENFVHEVLNGKTVS